MLIKFKSLLKFSFYRSQLPIFPYVCSRCLSQRSDSHFTLNDEKFRVYGQDFVKDELTSVTPYIVKLLKRNLIQTPQQPIHLVSEATKNFFRGYHDFYYDNPVVTPEDNFDALLISKDHISRSKKDTYYLTKDFLLRTHTSAHQNHCLSKGATKFICIGDVYRRDEIDRNHYPVFHQCEAFDTFTAQDLGLPTIYKANPTPRDESSQESYNAEATAVVETKLKQQIENYVKFLLNFDFESRWIPAYFPFTHPSWEFEILYQGKWLEVVGSGIVEEKILLNNGITGKIGWALGFGLERLAMVKYKIPDVRLFWSQDPAYLIQFRDLKSTDNYEFKPISKFPSRTFDISFLTPDDLLMDVNKYEKLSNETLELLCQQFEEMIESQTKLDDSDVELSNGVLTIKLAGNGTYVINKQTPNRQIWLSSPFSGPKRYDWMTNSWIYKRDQTSLQQLLSQELSKYIDNSVNFDLDSLTKLG